MGAADQSSLTPSNSHDDDSPDIDAATTNGQFDLSGLDGTDGFTLNGQFLSDGAGRSVSSAGDFNGDGFDDFLISAPFYSNNGAVYLVFGTDGGFNTNITLSSLDGSDGVRLEGATGDQLGSGRSGVSAAGDLNDDELEDIVLGAPNGNGGDGRAYVLFGRDQAFGPSFNLTTLDGSDGFLLTGSNGAFAGFSVSAAGDFDDDGIDDIILGGPFADPDGKNSAGEAYLVFGSDQGFNASLSLSNLDGNDGIIFEGAQPNDFLGVSVAGIGDINGSGPGDINSDGFDDLILGASTASANAGKAYVVFGDDSGFGARFDLADLTPQQGFFFTGLNSGDFLGTAVSGAGDADADGFADVIMGASGFNPGTGSGTGAAYLFIGRPNTFEIGTELDNLGNKRLIRLDGIADNDYAGVTVASAGDINGDGFHDTLLGAPSADPGGRNGSGESYLIFGRGDELYPPELNLQDLDGSDGFAISGVLAGDSSGFSVSSAGDIDNDGFDEIIIGAPNANNGAGAAYVLYGSPEYNPGFTKFGNDKDNTINGTAGADVILGLRGGDNINGRGNGDTLYGGFGADKLIGGGGVDKLLGGQGRDELLGDSGDDQLFGNGGVDILDGGVGNDFMNGGTGADDMKGGDGDDHMDGSADHDTMNGGGGADTLIGSRGNDLLIGGGGPDTLSGGNDNDDLRGGAGKDDLTGGEGNDTLNGGSGGDVMRGSVGNDTYVVAQATDKIIEKAGNGKDTVEAFVSYSLPANFENLTLKGNGNINGIGNRLANKIIGNGGANTLNGKSGNDTLLGEGGNDDLIGSSGKDILDGGSGRDDMAGGNGNDNYFVDNSNDKVSESSGGGTDLVTASASFSLPVNVEKLILSGGSAINATGNNQNNIIKGNNKANKIDGRGGNDTMTGRGGNDTFILGSNNGDDKINDFKSGQDKLDLTAYNFTSFAQVLNRADNNAGDLVIELNNNNSVRLKGFSKNQLKSGDVIINDDDGPPDKIDLPSEGEADQALDLQNLTVEGSELDLSALGLFQGGTAIEGHTLAVGPLLGGYWLPSDGLLDGIG